MYFFFSNFKIALSLDMGRDLIVTSSAAFKPMDVDKKKFKKMVLFQLGLMTSEPPNDVGWFVPKPTIYSNVPRFMNPL